MGLLLLQYMELYEVLKNIDLFLYCTDQWASTLDATSWIDQEYLIYAVDEVKVEQYHFNKRKKKKSYYMFMEDCKQVAS